MKVDMLKLEIFDGKMAPDDFIGDLEIFLNLEDDLKKEVIRNTFAWYPEKDIDEEWNKWMDKRTDKEKNQLKSAVRLVLFAMRTGLIKRFTDEHFEEELRKIGFDSNLIKFFLSELGRKKGDLVQKIEKIEVPIIAKLTDLNWRIDVKKSSTYSRKIDEPCIILKMSFSGAETREIVFELSFEELNSLMRTFSLILKEIAESEVEDGQWKIINLQSGKS